MDKRYRRKLTSVADVVIAAYRGGATLQEIADIHGVSPMTVRSFLMKRGIELRRRGPRYGNTKDKNL